MSRDPLSSPDFRPTFSGHETFPLRQLWLRKAYTEVSKHIDRTHESAPRTLFADEDSISRFGAGKNMVYAMRHWALASGILREQEGGYRPTPLGDYIFHPISGKDPYQERLATVWLIQWMLVNTPNHATTWYWVFNRFNYSSFSRANLENSLLKLIEAKAYKRLTAETIKRDVQCFLRTYCTTKATREDDFRTESMDDLAEPVLAELGLITPAEDGDFRFRRGQKLSLPDAVFNYALHNFWQNHSTSIKTLSFDSIAYEPGSPALVFKLDESALADRLMRIEETTEGRFVWSDTAGLRQVVQKKAITPDAFELLAPAYSTPGEI